MSRYETDEIIEMVTNLDDITGEACGWAIDRLMRSGALDASATPILMKKGRPGYRLEVLAAPENEEAIVRALFDETPTLGVRRRKVERRTLARSLETIRTDLGEVEVKRTRRPSAKADEVKPEREEVERLALANGVSTAEILKALAPGLAEAAGREGADE